MVKNQTPGKVFQGKEVFQRMNFLHQASHLLLATGPAQTDTSAYYGMLMCAAAKKAVLRMDPEIKRGVCKGCKIMLVPGVSARVRTKPRMLIWTCMRCGTIKRFPTKRGYKIWAEKPEACVGVLRDTVHENPRRSNQHTKETKKKQRDGGIVNFMRNYFNIGPNQKTGNKQSSNNKSSSQQQDCQAVKNTSSNGCANQNS